MTDSPCGCTGEPEPTPRNQQVPRCAYCLKPSTRLCDFIVEASTSTTCDRPMCEEHTRELGQEFVCTRSPRRCHAETIDYCREHRAET